MALGYIGLPVGFGHPVEEGHEVDEVEVVDIFVERQCRVDNGSVGHEQSVLDMGIELCELVKQLAGLVDPIRFSRTRILNKSLVHQNMQRLVCGPWWMA